MLTSLQTQETEITTQNSNMSFLEGLWADIYNFLPSLLLGLGFIIGAFLLLKIVRFILKRILKVTNVDKFADKLNEIKLFGRSNYKFKASLFILKTVHYLLLLILTIIAAELFGLTVISEGIGKLIAYLPILGSALFIFIIGVYLATIVQKSIKNTFKSLNINGASLVSNIIFYLIVVIVSITALNQAGVDTEIITKNLTLILGSVVVSFTIAFGLGARDVVLRLLFGFYSKKNFSIGQYIKPSDFEGVIEKIDNICVTLKTKEGTMVVPIKELVDARVTKME